MRVERVREISSADAKAEGIAEPRYGEGRYCSWVDPFRDLWDSINGKAHPWEANPWGGVGGFRRVEEERG